MLAALVSICGGNILGKIDRTHSTLPPASGRDLLKRIDQAVKVTEQWQRSAAESTANCHSALLWKALLELSKPQIEKGVAPSIRKNDFSLTLKGVAIDGRLWDRFQRFYDDHLREPLYKAASESGVPALSAQRITNGGRGGNPDATEAVFQLINLNDLLEPQKLSQQFGTNQKGVEQLVVPHQSCEHAAKSSLESIRPNDSNQGNQSKIGHGSESVGVTVNNTEPKVNCSEADRGMAQTSGTSNKRFSLDSLLIALSIARSPRISVTQNSSSPLVILTLVFCAAAVGGGAVSSQEFVQFVYVLSDILRRVVSIFLGNSGVVL